MINKTINKLTLAIIAAAALALPAHAADKKASAAAPEKHAATTTEQHAGSATDTQKTTAFRGVISSVDKEQKTITLANKKGTTTRTFTVGDNAKLTKGKETASWSDLTVGEKVHGTYMKTADGKMDIVTLKVGGKQAAEKTEKVNKSTTEKSETTTESEKE